MTVTVDETTLQAPDSERALIGAVAHHPDAVAGVLEQLPGSDFYDLVRGQVWDTCRALSAEREPITPVTVARRMAANNALSNRAQTIVQTEMSSASPAAHATRHAETVADLARRREMVQAISRAVTLVTEHPGDASDILSAVRAQFETIDGPDERSGGTLTWAQMLEEFEAAHTGQTARGIPTPWGPLNDLIGGLYGGRMYTIGGSPGDGKALALDTPIPTPHGWTTMGELSVGDVVMGADGLPTHVTQAYDVRHGRPCFEVEFSDGSVIVADAEHQWLTETSAARTARRRAAEAPRTSPFSHDQRHKMTTPSVVTTTQIAATLRTDNKDRRLDHSIPLCKPLDLATADLLIDPYVLGVWLGDGHSAAARFTSADPEIPLAVEAAGQPVVKHRAELNYGLPGMTVKLRALGVLDNKHIPMGYLRASESQRRALLAGLLDTDGTVWPNGTVEFSTTSPALAEGMYDLLVGLGYRTRTRTKAVIGRRPESSICYSMAFTAAEKVFRLTRKIEKQRTPQAARVGRRYIAAVRPIPSVPVRCIEVDNADHLYLAGRSMIATHNSTAALNLAVHAAERNFQTLVFSAEMPTIDVFGRIVGRGAEVDLRDINQRKLDGQQMGAIRDYAKRAVNPPLRVNADNVSINGIKTLARAHHHRHGLDVLVVDYLQLISSDAPARSQEEEIAKISTALKRLSRELDCAVVVPAQLNRNPAARADQRPTKADLRGSGKIEQDSDVVILLWHQQIDGRPTGDVTFILDKNRHGPRGEITLRWHGGYGAIG